MIEKDYLLCPNCSESHARPAHEPKYTNNTPVCPTCETELLARIND